MAIYKKIVLSSLLLLIISSITYAQEPQGQDPIDQFFFRPELIMQHQQKIDLSAEQQEQIISLVGEGQQAFTRLQWNIQGEMQALQEIIKESTVDDAAAIAQLDKVLEVEKKIKRAQIILFVRIKNLLTAEQQALLNQLKNKEVGGN